MREDHLARATVVIVIVGALRPRTAAALLGAPTDGRDWPSYGHDLHRTFNGRTTLDPTSVLGLARAWFFPTGDAVTANPIVVNGALYVGSWDGNFYALDAVSGQERWHFTIDPQLAIHPQPGNRQPGDLTSDGGVITSSAYFLPAAGAPPDPVIFGGGYTLYALRAAGGRTTSACSRSTSRTGRSSGSSSRRAGTTRCATGTSARRRTSVRPPTARRSSSASAPRTATATRWIRRPARSAGRPTSSSAASPAASSRPPRTTARGSTARPRSATSAASRQTGTSSASRSTPPTSRSRSRACTPSTPRPGPA